MNYIIGLLILTLFAGVLSGLAAIGGGIIMVTVLLFLFGLSLRSGQGCPVAALAPPIGLLAAYKYFKKGTVDIKAAAIIAAGFFLVAFKVLKPII